MLVPDHHRDRANAIQQLAGPASGIVAPVLAGLLFVLVGATGVMVIDLATFTVAVLVVMAVHIPHPEQTEEGRAMRTGVWHPPHAVFRRAVRRADQFPDRRDVRAQHTLSADHYRQ